MADPILDAQLVDKVVENKISSSLCEESKSVDAEPVRGPLHMTEPVRGSLETEPVRDPLRMTEPVRDPKSKSVCSVEDSFALVPTTSSPIVTMPQDHTMTLTETVKFLVVQNMEMSRSNAELSQRSLELSKQTLVMSQQCTTSLTDSLKVLQQSMQSSIREMQNGHLSGSVADGNTVMQSGNTVMQSGNNPLEPEKRRKPRRALKTNGIKRERETKTTSKVDKKHRSEKSDHNYVKQEKSRNDVMRPSGNNPEKSRNDVMRLSGNLQEKSPYRLLTIASRPSQSSSDKQLLYQDLTGYVGILLIYGLESEIAIPCAEGMLLNVAEWNGVFKKVAKLDNVITYQLLWETSGFIDDLLMRLSHVYGTQLLKVPSSLANDLKNEEPYKGWMVPHKVCCDCDLTT
jgi:hypothetical protein